MSMVNISPDGVAGLAALCESWACEVAAAPAPAGAGLSLSAEAVAAACARAERTGRALGARMRASAGLIRTAAAGVDAAEADAGAALGAVSGAR